MTSSYRTFRPPCNDRQPGFTLIEMMLVLAVLVVIGAMALPALRGPLEDQRLRKAADLIRAQWTHARVAAMKTGRIHVFRYQLGTGLYVVQPWQGETDAVEASSDLTAPTGLPATSPISPLNPRNARSPLGVAGALLPPGIVFYSGTTNADARAAEVEADMSNADAGAVTSHPIVFYPDGSATDARLVLTNERCFVELSLRGLTGLSRGSDLRAAEELTQ